MKFQRIALLAVPAFALVAAEAVRVASPVRAQSPADIAAKADAIVKAAFASSAPEWKSRLDGDETMQLCSASNNAPSADVAKKIEAAAKASMKYPTDGKLIGDWKEGEKLAQSGYGMRFTDYPPRNPNGGNCYACHQLTKQEVSYGTIGPSLSEYGKIRKYAEADVKASYEKLYNSHAVFPCSLMPRFGSNAVLSIEQIVHINALLMSPDSPVNK